MYTFIACGWEEHVHMHAHTYVSTKQFQETLHMQVVEKIEIATDGEWNNKPKGIFIIVKPFKFLCCLGFIRGA